MNKFHPSKTGIKAIAVYEVIKGALVLAAGIGLLSLINKDLQSFAENLVETLHLIREINTSGNLSKPSAI